MRIARPATKLGVGIALALLLASVQAPEAWGQASTDLHSGRIVSIDAEDVTHFGLTEPVFFFRIGPDDPFEFAIPISMIQRPNPDLYALGMALWWWQAPQGRLPFRMPNRVLVIRATLLATKAYFDGIARERGAPFAWPTAADPLPVQLGHFARRDSAAYVAITDTPPIMRFRVGVAGDFVAGTHEETAARAVHEYFHVVQRLLWPGDAEELDTFFETDPALMEFLLDTTSEWATDEPIRTGAAGPYGPIDLDAINRYRELRGTFFLWNHEPLLGRGQYDSTFLVKYFTEQVAGGRDRPRPGDVFDLLRRVYAADRLDRDVLLRALTEGLSAERFPGASWQRRWQRFFAAFNAAHIVQNGSAQHDPADRIAFLDDAFATADEALGFSLAGPPYGGFLFEKEQSLEELTALHREPAAGDEERIRRMQPLLQRVEIAPLSGQYHLLALQRGDRKELEARPVFLYAEGEPGTDVLFLEQILPENAPTHLVRAGTRFRWRQDFSLLDPSDAARPAKLLRHEIPPARGSDPKLAFAALNSAPGDTARALRWGYLVSPRLIPFEGGGSRGSETVKSIGEPDGRSPLAGFYNGDEFHFVVKTAGKVHLGADARNDVPRAERTLEADLRCGEAGASVQLDESAGPGLRVDAQLDPAYGGTWGRSVFYTISGRIHPRNPVTGDCHLRIELRSLLNLGAGDEEIDESFRFPLRDARPRVVRVRVRSGGNLVYDSEDGVREAAKPEDGAYRLGITVVFSEPMAPGHGAIEGRLRPDDPGPPLASGEALAWSRAGSEVTTTFEVGEDDVPEGGSFLWLAIAGESRAGRALDADPVEPGDQPDTHHFAMLGIDDFYLLTLAAESRYFRHWRNVADDGTVTQEVTRRRVRPEEIALRLLPAAEGPRELDAADQLRQMDSFLSQYIEAGRRKLAEYEGRVRDDPDRAANWERAIERTRKEIAGYERCKAAHARLRPRMQAVFDVLLGYRVYQFHFARSGPVPVRFAGATSYHERRTDHRGGDVESTEEKRRIPGQVVDDWRELEGWRTHLSHLPGHPDGWWGPFHGGHFLHVWRFDPARMAAAREAVLLGVELPEDCNPGYARDVRDLAHGFRERLLLLAPGQRVAEGVGLGSLPDVQGSRLWRLDTTFVLPQPTAEGVARTTVRNTSFTPALFQTRESAISGVERSLSPDASGRDVLWSFGAVSGMTPASSLTHGFPVPRGRGPIVVTGQSFGDRFFGDLHGRWRDAPGERAGTVHARLHWHIERNGAPGRGTHPPAPVTGIARAAPRPRAAPEREGGAPETGGPDAPEGGTPAEGRRAEGADGDPEREDEPAAPPDGRRAGPPPAGPRGDLPPPRPVEERPFRGRRPTFVAQADTGTVLGGIAAPDLAPGRVAVTLEGPGLGAPEPATVAIEVGRAEGFQYGFHGVPVGGYVVFRNAGEREVVVHSVAREDPVELRIPGGEERAVAFARPGTVRFLDDRGRRLRLLVAPSDHLVVMDGRAYAFRNVPPGIHLLRVHAEERDVRPAAEEVEVWAGRITERDVLLERRE